MQLRRPHYRGLTASFAGITFGVLLQAGAAMADERAALRAQVLTAEHTVEQAHLAAAQRRFIERSAAGDLDGVAQAQATVAAHERNLQALSRELESLRAAHPNSTAPLRAAPTARRTVASEGAGQWWDVYARPALPQAPNGLSRP
jgi:hypothetical protein